MMFGADPEFFLFRGETPVGAHEVFGTKERVKGPDRVFRDGFGVELNASPSNCRALFYSGLRVQMLNARAEAARKGLTLVAKDAIHIDLDSLASAPDDLKHFGCDPARDAYDGGRNKVADIDAASHPLRYAGGHLHFGISYYYPWDSNKRAYDKENPKLTAADAWIGNKDNHPTAVKLLDLYVGLPIAYILGGEEQYERRKVYGKAGEYRSQKYTATAWAPPAVGIEYRVPGSSMWNTHILPCLAHGVGRQIMNAFAFYASKWDEKLEDSLREAINTGYGQEDILKRISMPGFYTFETLRLARQQEALRKFTFDTPKWEHEKIDECGEPSDYHYGWGEHTMVWARTASSRKAA